MKIGNKIDNYKSIEEEIRKYNNDINNDTKRRNQ